MQPIVNQVAEKVAQYWQQYPQVEAVAVAGSQMSGHAGVDSDIDIYIYTTVDFPAAQRLEMARSFSPGAQLIDFWGPGLEWDDPATGIHLDNVFFSAAWIDDQIDRVLLRHEPSLGYSTAFLNTVSRSYILFDRNGWFAALVNKARRPYPEALAHAIIALNFPVLRSVFPSYRVQLLKAAKRRDGVSLNHRAAALLASYFDILFAVNRLPHPGEKRLIEFVEKNCAKRPATFSAQVQQLLTACAVAPDEVSSAVDELCDGLEALLRDENLLPTT